MSGRDDLDPGRVQANRVRPDPGFGRRAMASDPRRSIMFWVAPTMVVLLLAVIFGGAYLGGNVNPRTNLHGFPVAIVNADIGATAVDGTRIAAGDQIVDGLVAGIDADQFELRHLGGSEALKQMGRGELYGAIVIPNDFSANLNAWGIGTMVRNEVVPPEIRIVTNPRAGIGAATIVRELGFQVGDRVDDAVGRQLLERVNAAAADAPEGAAPPPGTAMAAAASPVEVSFEEFSPMPDGTGNGLSAFYWTLLIVLAGFTGGMVTSQMVDNRLGIHALEWGPITVRKPRSRASRTSTLAAKFGLSAMQSVLVAALYVVIGMIVGMPMDSPLGLGAFTATMIMAVGWVSHAVLALLGNPGLIVNMVVFIILGLPSAGGTLPLEAVPEVFRLLGLVSPMHQIYLGSRSMLYLGGSWESGIGHALTYAVISVAAATVIGFAVTAWFDRRGWRR